MAPGEEELLGNYFRELGPDGKNDFFLPPGDAKVIFGDDFWEYFEKSPQRKAQLQADRISYLWDKLIERFNQHAINGTLYHVSKDGLQGHERAVRFMARESRTRRRMLAEALLGVIDRTSPGQRGVRLMAPSEPGDPVYVFLLLPCGPDRTQEEYRLEREQVLIIHCMIAKLHFPEAKHIIGFATETEPTNGGRSEDLLYYDASAWTEAEEQEARRLQEETGWLTKLERSEGREYQFPPVPASGSRSSGSGIQAKGSARNDPCPCGSGKKLKKCHGV
jgi:SEC-C motif-containing protein